MKKWRFPVLLCTNGRRPMMNMIHRPRLLAQRFQHSLPALANCQQRWFRSSSKRCDTKEREWRNGRDEKPQSSPSHWVAMGMREETATRSSLHKQYVELCKKYHPDVYGGDGEAFRQLKTAYERCVLEKANEQNRQHGEQNDRRREVRSMSAESIAQARCRLRQLYDDAKSLQAIEELFHACLFHPQYAWIFEQVSSDSSSPHNNSQRVANQCPAEPLSMIINRLHRFTGFGIEHCNKCLYYISEWEAATHIRASAGVFNDILLLYAEDQWVPVDDHVQSEQQAPLWSNGRENNNASTRRVQVREGAEVVEAVLEAMTQRELQPDDWTNHLARFARVKAGEIYEY